MHITAMHIGLIWTDRRLKTAEDKVLRDARAFSFCKLLSLNMPCAFDSDPRLQSPR